MNKEPFNNLSESISNNRRRDDVFAKLNQDPDRLEYFLNEDEWKNETNNEVNIPYDEQHMFNQIRESAGIKRKAAIYTFCRRYAAILVCCMFIGSLLSIGIYEIQKGKNSKDGKGIVQSINKPFRIHKFSNKSLIWLKVKLPDGTKCNMAPLCYLEYYERNKERKVEMTGEAIFDVNKNKNKFFCVHTGSLKTTVLGTIFEINYNSITKKLRVTLYAGKVVVQKEGKKTGSIWLNPGQYCLFQKDELKTISSTRNTEKEENRISNLSTKNTLDLNMAEATIIEKDSTIEFRNALLSEVIHYLENKYNTHIVLTEKSQRESLYSGKFNRRGLKPENILKIIGIVNDLQIEKIDTLSFIIKKP